MISPPLMPGLPLEDALPVVVPLLAPALAPTNARPRLGAMARALPPVPHGGFECRLAEGPGAVDLHQGLRRSRGDHHVLSAFLAQQDEGARAHPAWAALRRFATWWAEADSDAAREVESVILEVDSDGPNEERPVPSAFFKLGPTGGLPAARASNLVQALLDVLGLPALAPRQAEVFDVCSDRQVPVTHVGMMLSRDTRALRINAASGRALGAVDLLRALDWQGDPDPVTRDAEWLHDVVETVVCCLDVDDAVYPNVGLECFPGKGPSQNERWRSFLDALIDRDLCVPDKADGLLGFPRLVSPATSAVPWPDPLIVASLLAGDAERFSTFSCTLHHVKLAHAPDRSATAKGYLGFLHLWVGPDGRPLNSDAVMSAVPSSTPPDVRPRV